MLETLVFNGLDERQTREALPRTLSAMTRQLAARSYRFRGEGAVLPGVRELLDHLGSTDVIQSVLTGSLRANALLKLETFGLQTHLDLEVAAFGDDAFSRPELVDVARVRARSKYGGDFGGAQTLLIGDSLHDVDAARSTGAGVIAVATGIVSMDELSARGAQLVLADLTDPGAASAILAEAYRP
jgi:phosphoglycolate phosphatase